MDIQAAFKPFDIRGVYPTEIDDRFAFSLGKTLVSKRPLKKILVAADARPNSSRLKNFLIDGLSQAETKVYDQDIVPIPQFYFALAGSDFDAGIMVTASHISDQESGFKLVNRNGLPFDQGEILALKNVIAGFLKNPIIVPKIEAIPFNNFTVYINALQKALPKQNFSSRVLVDYTNSAVELVIRELFKRLKMNYETVASENSGNPLLEENRRQLEKEMQSKKADLGIIWDSDGDRVAFVDSVGELIPMTFVLGLLASEEVAKHPHSTAVADVRAGLVVRDLVAQAGGKLEVTPAWSQFFKFAMAEDKSIVFGGETSGHFVFRDFNCVDDGIYSALKFLYLWENRGAKDKLPLLHKRYFELPERNFSCSSKKAPFVLEKLSEYFRQKGYDISIKDGLSVFGPDFKFNLRSSLTENYLRLNLEAKSEKSAGAVVSEIEQQLEKTDV